MIHVTVKCCERFPVLDIAACYDHCLQRGVDAIITVIWTYVAKGFQRYICDVLCSEGAAFLSVLPTVMGMADEAFHKACFDGGIF